MAGKTRKQKQKRAKVQKRNNEETRRLEKLSKKPFDPNDVVADILKRKDGE